MRTLVRWCVWTSSFFPWLLLHLGWSWRFDLVGKSGRRLINISQWSWRCAWVYQQDGGSWHRPTGMSEIRSHGGRSLVCGSPTYVRLHGGCLWYDGLLWMKGWCWGDEKYVQIGVLDPAPLLWRWINWRAAVVMVHPWGISVASMDVDSLRTQFFWVSRNRVAVHAARFVLTGASRGMTPSLSWSWIFRRRNCVMLW